MRGPGRVDQSPSVVESGRAAQSLTQKMLANWGSNPDKEAAEKAKRDKQEKLGESIDKRQIEESLLQSKAKKEQRKKEQAPIIQAQKIASERQAIQERENARHSRLLRENSSYRRQFDKEQAEAQAQAQAQAQAKVAQAQAQAKAKAKAAQAQELLQKNNAPELGKRKRDEVEQDNFFSNSLKSFTQWASPLTSNLGGPFSLPNPFAPKAPAPPIDDAQGKPGIVEEFKGTRPEKKQRTNTNAITNTIQTPKSTPTPSDYGQFYLDGLYKRFNNGDNNFNIKTIIKEKDMSVKRGNEQDRVSYLNQRVAKWEIELSKFGITQTAPKKIQTDDVFDLEGNEIKRDDFLIQYGDYLKENIKTLKNEATNNSGSKDRNNKLNHLIAFHYLELAKMVCAGSEGLHDNLTNIPTKYKGFLEYSVGNSEFISTGLIQKPISVKTTDLGPRALRDIKYLEEDIHKKLTGEATNICTLAVLRPFDEVAYRNQVAKITNLITIDDKTSQKKSAQQKLDELKERSQEAANRGSLAERYLPHALSEIVSSKSRGQQKQAPFSGVFNRAAPASMSFTQEDARKAYLEPPSGLGYGSPSTYVRSLLTEAARDKKQLEEFHGSKVGMLMLKRGYPSPGERGR